jgi:hypothetical protein
LKRLGVTNSMKWKMLFFGHSPNYTFVELPSQCNNFDALRGLRSTSLSEEMEVWTYLEQDQCIFNGKIK